MATTPEQVVQIEQKVILHGISWETYERLLAEHEESSGTRFFYDHGVLEIMVLSLRHERLNRTLALLVEIWAEEMSIDLQRVGSTTFKRADLLKGFEPDSCFYIQNAQAIAGKDELDLTTAPPPDLVIEVDISRPSLDKSPVYAAVGVPEVWRYDGARVGISRREGRRYVEIQQSIALPLLTSEAANHLLHESRELKSTVWLRRVREWVQAQKKGGLPNP